MRSPFPLPVGDLGTRLIGKTKRRLHDRKTEHFKALTKDRYTSAIADYISSAGHNIKWDHFEILTTMRYSQPGNTMKNKRNFIDLRFKTLNENVASEKLFCARIIYYNFLQIESVIILCCH